MAAGDSSANDLDKRTRELDKRSIEKGHGLQEKQLAQNQLQAILDESRNNITTSRAIEQQVQGQNQILAQAGQMVAASTPQQVTQQPQPEINPATQAILQKYQGAPKITRTQGRDVKVTPNKITINNTYNTQTTNNVNAGGPTQGRPIMIRQPQAQASPGQGTDGGQSKFKTWLGGVFDSQKQDSIRREREFDKRESSLTRAANKMMRRIESAGKDIIDNMNPRVLGTTVRSQLQMLLFLFAGRFLAKNWTKVLDVLVGITNKIKSFLDYIGITGKGKSLAAAGKGLRGDIIYLFGGDPRKDSIVSVFTRLGKELMDYLKKKFDDGMSERGEAIRAIKFPKLDFSNIGEALSGITGYLSSILAAMVDPKKGLEVYASQGVQTAGRNSSAEATYKDLGLEHQTFAKNTDMGALSLESRHSLLSNALEGNDLKDNAASEISQGRDLIGVMNEARTTGKVDTARLATGLDRMQRNAENTGGVIVDQAFLNMYLPKWRDQVGKTINPVKLKYVVRKKTVEEAGSNGFWDAAGQSWLQDTIIDSVGNKLGMDSFTRGALMGRNASGRNGSLAYDGFSSFMNSIPIVGPLIVKGNHALAKGVKRALSNDYTVDLVPEDDPRPAIKLAIGYSLTPQAISLISQRLTSSSKINTGDAVQLKHLESVIRRSAGGDQAVNRRFQQYKSNGHENETQYDFNTDQVLETQRKLDTLQKNHKDEEDAMMPTWKIAGDNMKSAINTGIGKVEDLFNGVKDWAYDATAAKNASFSYTGKLGQVQQTTRGFNVARAVQTLNYQAHPRTTHKCRRYVEDAIESGFGLRHGSINSRLTHGNGSAWSLAEGLPKLGFAPISWSNYQPQAGDIVVMPQLPGHQDGHVAMFNGNSWVSDYAQQDLWGGDDMRHYKKGVIFRHLSQSGGTYDPSIYQTANGTEQIWNTSYDYGGSYGDGFVADNGYGSMPIGNYSFGYGSNYVSKLSRMQVNGNVKKAIAFFEKKGLTHAQAAGIVGNLYQESKMDPGAFNRARGGNGAFGIAQWRGQRQAALRAMYGNNPTFDDQLNFTWHELTTNKDYRNTFNQLTQAQTASQAADIFSKGYERPGDNSTAQRQAFAEQAAQGVEVGGNYNPITDVTNSTGYDDTSGKPGDIKFGRLSTMTNKEKRAVILKSEAQKLWDKYKDLRGSFGSFREFENYWLKHSQSQRQKLMQGLNTYNNHRDAIQANEETKYMSAIDFAENWSKVKNGWSYINQWEKNNQYNKRAGFGNTYTKLYQDWMYKQSNHGTFDANELDKHNPETFKKAYDKIIKGEDVVGENASLDAGILFGKKYMDMKNEYDKLSDVHNTDPYRKEKLEKLQRRLKRYEDAALGFKKAAKGKDLKSRQHSYSKFKSIAEIGNNVEDIIDKKNALDLKYSKLALQWGNMTIEQRQELVSKYYTEYNSLDAQQNKLQDQLTKLTKTADKGEKDFIVKTKQQIKLMNTSKQDLQDAFGKALSETGNYLDAIKKMIKEYGDGVRDRIASDLGLPELNNDMLNPNTDWGQKAEEQAKVYKEHPFIAKTPEDIYDEMNGQEIFMHTYGKNPNFKAKGKNNIFQYTQFGQNRLLANSTNYIGGSDRVTNGKGKVNISGNKSGFSFIPYRTPEPNKKKWTGGFVDGGYTKEGKILEPAGEVHAGEWVAPQKMVKSRRFGPVIAALEKARVTDIGDTVSKGLKKQDYDKSPDNLSNNNPGKVVVDPLNAQGQSMIINYLSQIASNTVPKPEMPEKIKVKSYT